MRLCVYASKHAKSLLPGLRKHRGLEQVPWESVYFFFRDKVGKATDGWANFDPLAELCVHNDGINPETDAEGKVVGPVCSIVWLAYQSITGSSNQVMVAFRSARLYANQPGPKYNNCWWLENGATYPTGQAHGNSFLRLIHLFLYNLGAARMYLQVAESNQYNKKVYQ